MTTHKIYNYGNGIWRICRRAKTLRSEAFFYSYKNLKEYGQERILFKTNS